MTLVRILFLEDEEQDVELMLHELGKAGVNNISKRVFSRHDFLEALDHFHPDVIIADYTLPMFNGMHAFRLFKDKKMSIPFILATGSLTDEIAIEMMSEGIDDFILKSSYKRLPTVVLRCLQIKSAENEKNILAMELESKTLELNELRERAERSRKHEQLSNREFEILCLIASGKTIKDIAEQLFLSPATVATYRARLLEKMDLKSNVDLTHYAIRNKLIE